MLLNEKQNTINSFSSQKCIWSLTLHGTVWGFPILLPQ